MPFTLSDGFSMAAMTAAINKLPNLFNRVASLFPEEPINTTTVKVEQRNGTLNIVTSKLRGEAADKIIADKRAIRTFAVPHIPVMDVVLPDEIQNVRAFGSDNAMESQAAVIARKQQKMKNVLDQTREHLACGALKGIILDADGSELYNLYTEFGIDAKTVDFALDDDATIVLKKCLEVKRHIEANLKGESMTGIRALCSSTFFDALTTHPEVEKAFAAYQALNQNLADDYRRGFRFGGIVFEEYAANWTDKAIVFPEGTASTFKTIVAPGNFVETANTMGIPYYSKIEQKKFGAGYEMWAESNVLPICLRPEVLVEISI
jgi:hypothetical protein